MDNLIQANQQLHDVVRQEVAINRRNESNLRLKDRQISVYDRELA